MPHRGASSFAEQTAQGSACPAWLRCQPNQHSFFACVYRFSTTTKQPSTVSANEEKKCLVESGKVRNTILAGTKDHPYNRLRTPKRLYEPTQTIVRARPNGYAYAESVPLVRLHSFFYLYFFIPNSLTTRFLNDFQMKAKLP